MKKVRGKLIIIISIFLFFMIFISKSIGYDAIINSQEYQTRVNDVAELFDSEYERKRAEAQAIIEASQVHASSNEKTKYVFITKDSSKYHSAGCDYIDRNPYRVTLEYARNNGYGPCKYCNPYSQYKNYENAWWDNRVFIICIIVIIIVFIIIFFLSKRKKKQKNVLNNFDGYNIGNSSMRLDTDNFNNTNKTEDK